MSFVWFYVCNPKENPYAVWRYKNYILFLVVFAFFSLFLSYIVFITGVLLFGLFYLSGWLVRLSVGLLVWQCVARCCKFQVKETWKNKKKFYTNKVSDNTLPVWSGYQFYFILFSFNFFMVCLFVCLLVSSSSDFLFLLTSIYSL